MIGIDKQSDGRRKSVAEEHKRRYEIQKMENFILKPHRNENKIFSLSLNEIEKYMQIDIEKLKKMDLEGTLIAICEKTQEYIKENKENIFKIIKEREEKEDGR